MRLKHRAASVMAATRKNSYVQSKSALAVGVFLCSILLSACEVGSPESKTGTSGTGSPVPSSDAASSSGPVTGVASLGVAGTSLDTTEAKALVNTAGTRPSTDIRLGMTVDASGELVSGTIKGKATKLVAQSAVRGPVAALDLALMRVTTVGVVAQIDQNTIFENFSTLSELTFNKKVEIYGLQQTTVGRITATRIILLNANEPDTVEVLGTATNTTSTTVVVNGANVTTTQAQVILPNGVALSAPLPPNTVVAANARVRIVGKLDSTGNIIANQIIAGLSPTREANAIVSIDGIVSISTPAEPNIIQIGEDKIDLGGLIATTASQISPGVRVQIRGRKQGTIVRATEGRVFTNAERIEYRVEGIITEFKSIASFKVSGETVSAITANFVGGGTADLGVGKKIRIRGVAGAGVIDATELTFIQ
jgi:hypothetical protein